MPSRTRILMMGLLIFSVIIIASYLFLYQVLLLPQWLAFLLAVGLSLIVERAYYIRKFYR
ncbi:hypothetical protein [Texcoconibacillus texcoconensis]|uniref:Uncharacterized protein (DUF983 family) n=1 Tax=Texcoconibacillus texcoconensis TaxID=1095777 RepID=A0A840QTX9_9BACI|nr:hypothetical protein [Texcoconibacillus texcoconensis]MBB5174824.1 uncharacterized protein (DUF983 family) [Texcoconibacillus texcoconensis]